MADTRMTPGQLAKKYGKSPSTISHAATRRAFPAELVTDARVHPYYLINDGTPEFQEFLRKLNSNKNPGGRKKKQKS